MNVMSRTLITHKGRTIGYETLDATGRHFHLGQPPRTHQAPPQARCPECQRYRTTGNAACDNCGALPTPMPAAPVTPGMIPMPVPDVPWYRQHAAAVPDIGQQLDDAIRARSNGRVGNFGVPPSPIPVVPLVHARALLTFAGPASTLEAVRTHQETHGGVLAQPARPQAVRVMATTSCERCHKQACGCPPPAPATLALVAQRQAARLATMERAAVDAGLQAIEKRVGMNA